MVAGVWVMSPIWLTRKSQSTNLLGDTRLSLLMSVTVAKLFVWTVPTWDYVEKAYRSFGTSFNPVFLPTMVVGGFGSLPSPEAWR